MIGVAVPEQVEIRVNEDAPAYPTTVDSSLVPLGRLPLGDDGFTHDARPASEGGCTFGPFAGCHIYNIKVTPPCKMPIFELSRVLYDDKRYHSFVLH